MALVADAFGRNVLEGGGVAAHAGDVGPGLVAEGRLAHERGARVGPLVHQVVDRERKGAQPRELFPQPRALRDGQTHQLRHLSAQLRVDRAQLGQARIDRVLPPQLLVPVGGAAFFQFRPCTGQ